MIIKGYWYTEINVKFIKYIAMTVDEETLSNHGLIARKIS